MVRYRYWVSVEGWPQGGYENAHFAKDEEAAREQIRIWNQEHGKEVVTLVSITEISDREYIEEYMHEH